MPQAEINRKHSSLSPRIDVIEETPPESLSGLTAAQKSIGLHGWCAKSAEKIWKALSFAAATAPAIMPASLKIPDRKSTRLNSSHVSESRMPSSACKKN